MGKYLKGLARVTLRSAKNFSKYCYWMPVLKGNKGCFNIFTHLTKTKRLLLYKLALSLCRNCVIVEVGSYVGGSSTFLASAATEKNGMLYRVDTWKNEAMSEGLRDTYNEFTKNTKTYEKWIVPLRGESVEVAKNFDKEIDLLFIDGDHSYEAVKSDVEAWFPKLKDGAIVVFHDYGWAEGVKRVVKEMVKPIQIGKGNNELPNTYWTRIKKDDIQKIVLKKRNEHD